MWLGFFKECMVSLIFLWINLLFLSITFFGSQLKLCSVSQQCFAISFLSQSQFLIDLLCSSECNFKDFNRSNCFSVTTVNFRNNIIFIFCCYSIFRFTKEFTQSVFIIEGWSYFMRSKYAAQFFTSTFNVQ